MRLIDNVTLKRLTDCTRATGRMLSATVKVLIVTVGSVFAVIFASLIISIIQFQLRLTEARTQNGNITLESVQLIADYQDNVSHHYKQLRMQADQLSALRVDYLSKLNSTTQLITSLCTALNAQMADQCYERLQELINNNSNQIDTVVAEFSPKSVDSLKQTVVPAYVADLKKIVTSGALQEAQTKFFDTQNFVQSECQRLTQYVSDQLGTSSLLSVSPELRMTIVVQCYGGAVGDRPAGGAAQVTPVAANAALPDNGPAAQNPNDVSGVNRILLSELVFYYKFYDWLTSFMGTNFRQIILSPPEFIVIMLVIATGILGSFLFHTYSMFVAKSTSEFPTLFSIGLRATLSVMCALVIYILSRTGFVAITEGGRHGTETAISPFVIAFVSVASGLMAEKALERIRSVGIKALQSRADSQRAARAVSQKSKKRRRSNG
jgi:hypothetical protein